MFVVGRLIMGLSWQHSHCFSINPGVLVSMVVRDFQHSLARTGYCL